MEFLELREVTTSNIVEFWVMEARFGNTESPQSVSPPMSEPLVAVDIIY